MTQADNSRPFSQEAGRLLEQMRIALTSFDGESDQDKSLDSIIRDAHALEALASARSGLPGWDTWWIWWASWSLPAPP